MPEKSSFFVLCDRVGWLNGGQMNRLKFQRMYVLS